MNVPSPREIPAPADALTRLQDLYVLGDPPRAQYVMRRQAIEEEVQQLGAPADPCV
jgi:hypothetical protein